jgi:hypothetical protein
MTGPQLDLFGTTVCPGSGTIITLPFAGQAAAVAINTTDIRCYACGRTFSVTKFQAIGERWTDEGWTGHNDYMMPHHAPLGGLDASADR